MNSTQHGPPSNATASTPPGSTAPQPPPWTRRLGRTGLDVSALTVGTHLWGAPSADPDDMAASRLAEARLADLVAAIADSPVTLVDTANMYTAGGSETALGRLAVGPQAWSSNILLQTKLDRDMTDGTFTGAQMWRSLEESLGRLGVDSVPILYLHDPEYTDFDEAMAPSGPVAALLDMREQGLTKHIGVSGGPVPVLRRYVDTGLFDVLITHNRFTLLERSADPLIDAATARGMGVINAAPYGSGILVAAAGRAQHYGYLPAQPEITAAAERMREACDRHGVPLAATALQLSLRDTRIASTIVGITSADRLRETLRLAATPIPPELWTELDDLAPAPLAWLDA